MSDATSITDFTFQSVAASGIVDGFLMFCNFREEVAEEAADKED
jgi:hypothetical protein